MNNDYAKVLLYAYPQMMALSEASGAAAENKAALSYLRPEGAFALAEAVAEEILTRRSLEEVYETLTEICSGLTEEEKYLLEYKYFRRKRRLNERFRGYAPDYSERTYFRRQRALLKKVVFLLSARGWTEERYRSAFGGYSPFRRLLSALRQGRERALAKRRGSS